MKKRLLASLLCLVMLVGSLADEMLCQKES